LSMFARFQWNTQNQKILLSHIEHGAVLVYYLHVNI